jgi:spore germination protein GerM
MRTQPRILVRLGLLITLVTCTVLSGCAFSFLPEKTPRPGSTTVALAPSDAKLKAMLYFPDKEWRRMVTEERTTARTGEPAYVTALREFMRGPIDDSAAWPFPPGVTLVSEPKVSNGIVFVNFSPEIARIRLASPDAELLLLQSLVYTVTETREVSAVQILIDGDRFDTLAGSVRVSEPLRRESFPPRK